MGSRYIPEFFWSPLLMWDLPPSLPHFLSSSYAQITHLPAPTQSVFLVSLIRCSADQTPPQKERLTCDHLPTPLELFFFFIYLLMRDIERGRDIEEK